MVIPRKFRSFKLVKLLNNKNNKMKIFYYMNLIIQGFYFDHDSNPHAELSSVLD